MTNYRSHLIGLCIISSFIALVPSLPVLSYGLYGFIGVMGISTFILQFDQAVESMASRKYKKGDEPLEGVHPFVHVLFHTTEVSLLFAAGWPRTALVWGLLVLSQELGLYEVKNRYKEIEDGEVDVGEDSNINSDNVGAYITQHDEPPSQDALGLSFFEYMKFHQEALKPGVEPKCSHITAGSIKNTPIRIFGDYSEENYSLALCILFKIGTQTSDHTLDLSEVKEIRFHTKYPSYAPSSTSGTFSGKTGVIDVYNMEEKSIFSLVKTLTHEVTHADDQAKQSVLTRYTISAVDKLFGYEIGEKRPNTVADNIQDSLLNLALSGIIIGQRTQIDTTSLSTSELIGQMKNNFDKSDGGDYDEEVSRIVDNTDSDQICEWLASFAYTQVERYDSSDPGSDHKNS